jgi:heme-degrading monooxygenase HmoA
MYVLRLEGTVAAGRAGEFEDTMRKLGDLLAQHPGFDRGALLNSYGYPAKYTRMIRFLDRESARAWERSAELATFREKHSLNGIYTASRPAEAYELVHAARGEGKAGYVHMADWTVSTAAANAATFEADRKELFELRRSNGQGFVAMLLLRFLGGQGRYVQYSVSTDEAAAAASGAVPENRRWVQNHPAASYGGPGPVQEAYELLQAYVPK